MRKLLSALVLVVLLAVTTTSLAFARELREDKVVFGDTFTLKSGETLDGNLVVFGGNVTVEEGATITGDVVVIGGNVELGGTVENDLVVIGGNVDLLSTAVVEGKLVSSGGSTRRAEGSEVKGGETQGFSPRFDWPTPIEVGSRVRPIDFALSLIWNGLIALGWTVALSLMAMLVVLFMPEQTARVSGAVAGTPVLSGLLGLLTLVAFPVVAVVVAITICLSPLSLIGTMIFGIGLLFGWLALGALIGERLAASLRWRDLSPMLAAGLGTFLITLLVSGLSILPGVGECLGTIIGVVLAALGLGAVVLTRFGTRPYYGTPAAPNPPPPTITPPESSFSDSPPVSS